MHKVYIYLDGRIESDDVLLSLPCNEYALVVEEGKKLIILYKDGKLSTLWCDQTYHGLVYYYPSEDAVLEVDEDYNILVKEISTGKEINGSPYLWSPR